MKRTSTLFLKTVIVLIAIAVLTAMLWFPQTEGRAVDLDLFSIYSDPFIIYSYIAAVPFFIALYQTFKLLGYIGQEKVFSPTAVMALRKIKYCALSISAFIVLAILYIRFMVHGDDPAGPTMLGFIGIFTSVVIATAAGIFQKLLQNVVDMKSEHDLTV